MTSLPVLSMMKDYLSRIDIGCNGCALIFDLLMFMMKRLLVIASETGSSLPLRELEDLTKRFEKVSPTSSFLAHEVAGLPEIVVDYYRTFHGKDMVTREFAYDESKPLDGIIANLTRKCDGNVHEAEIVNVTASSVYEDRWKTIYYPKNAVDLETDSFYESTNEANACICYGFKDMRVISSSYSVRSYGWGPGGFHLKSWAIEVSNDGSSWVVIDRRDGNDGLNDKFVTANFKIPHVPSERFRFFRLRQIGRNHDGKPRLTLSSLEIFGTLFER